MTETLPEYTLPTRSPYQSPVLSEENSLITKLLNAKDETGDRFNFTGKHINGFPSYSLWDSQEAYDKHVQRGQNKAKIFKIVGAHNFGEGLSDETLEQILELIESKQP